MRDIQQAYTYDTGDILFKIQILKVTYKIWYLNVKITTLT